jgi:two-component system, OmpR family, sensor kinase
MTGASEGAGRRPGNWASRAWSRVRLLSRRTSLRTKLVAAVFSLVLIAVAAMGTAGISLLRGELLGGLNGYLQDQWTEQNGQVAARITNCVQIYLQTGANTGCPQNVSVSWIPVQGSPVSISSPPANYYSYSVYSPPNLTGVTSWLADNPRQSITVPAAKGGGKWRVMGFTALNGNGTPAGSIVIGEDATSTYNTIRQLTDLDIVISLAILLVVTIAGFLVVQANLRPLVKIEETAEEIAEGHLNRRVPERDPRTEIGSLGRSLNTMLSQIESAFHDREKSEAAAHESEERMRRFIADASHELRTPLTTIRGFAEYYRQRGGLIQQWDEDEPQAASGLTPADLDRIMHRVEAEAARMGLLVEDLLVLARIDQQRPLARNPVDLLTLAADAVHDSRMLAENRDISLTVQPGAAFIVIGDEPRLRQVIGNLMSNALTHTPDGTSIEVMISSGTVAPEPVPGELPPAPTPAVVLEVKDYGPGMTAEQANRVFERFYRADQARTRATGGSGLGLAIVAALVAAHGGTASVQTAPGQGATFRVVLPLAPEAQGWADDADPDDEPEDVAPEDADFGIVRPS